jgi:hypothetical protein
LQHLHQRHDGDANHQHQHQRLGCLLAAAGWPAAQPLPCCSALTSHAAPCTAAVLRVALLLLLTLPQPPDAAARHAAAAAAAAGPVLPAQPSRGAPERSTCW